MKVFALFGRPTFLRAFHGWCTMFWIPFTGISYTLHWLESVTFVSLVSMVALFLGSFSSWQAARVEVKQDTEIGQTNDENRSGCCEHCSLRGFSSPPWDYWGDLGERTEWQGKG